MIRRYQSTCSFRDKDIEARRQRNLGLNRSISLFSRKLENIICFTIFDCSHDAVFKLRVEVNACSLDFDLKHEKAVEKYF